MQNLNAEVIAIGTEILLGEITDTNSVYIARVLRDLGINLYYMTSVGDNEERIARAIEIALSRAQIVITCGGLGPTVDDMTRQAVAAATRRGLTFHQYLLDQIAARFAGFRMTMTDNNRRQAYLPDNAIVVENPVGTAPSFIVEYEGNLVISLPGVPREMKFLMNEKIVPYLREHYNLGIIKARVLRTAGIGESTLDDMIGKDLLEASNPTVGLAAHSGQVDVRITAKAETEALADQMIERVETLLRQRVGPYIYGVNSETLEDALVGFARTHRIRLAVSETGLNEAVTSRISSAENGAEILAATETYQSPDQLLAAKPQLKEAAMQEMALAVAQGVRETSGADVGIAIISQPDIEEKPDKEQATGVAVYLDESKFRSRGYGFGGKAEMTRVWVTTWALSMAWRLLCEKYETG